MRPHLTSSVTFALVASEGTGHLQTGYIGLQVAARRNPFVPGGWLRAHGWLRTPSSALGRRQHSHCSANLHSARRQEFFGSGTEWNSLPATLRKPDIEFVQYSNMTAWKKLHWKKQAVRKWNRHATELWQLVTVEPTYWLAAAASGTKVAAACKSTMSS